MNINAAVLLKKDISIMLGRLIEPEKADTPIPYPLVEEMPVMSSYIDLVTGL